MRADRPQVEAQLPHHEFLRLVVSLFEASVSSCLGGGHEHFAEGMVGKVVLAQVLMPRSELISRSGVSRLPARDPGPHLAGLMVVNFKSGFDCLPTMRLWEKTV